MAGSIQNEKPALRGRIRHGLTELIHQALLIGLFERTRGRTGTLEDPQEARLTASSLFDFS